MLLTTKGFKKPELGDIADLRTFVGDNMDLLETELDKKSDNIDTLSLLNERELTKDPTGFTNNENIIVTYDTATRKITLNGTFEAYYKGAKIEELVDGWVSDAHSATLDKTYYLRYNGTAFTFNETPWDFSELMIALVQYGTNNKIAMKETHGFMPQEVHRSLHNTIGSYKSGGGTLTSASYVLNSTTATNRRPLVDATTIYDEDLKHVINPLITRSYTQKYLVGSETRTFVVGATEIIPVNGNIPYYNQNNAGTWQQTPMSNGDYAAVWLTAIPVTNDANSQSYRYIWTQPQSIGSLTEIRSLVPNDLNIGTSSSILSEYIFISKVIINVSANNWTIVEVINLTGNRYSQTGSPTGSYLSIVNVDSTLTGDGTSTTPLSVANPSTGTNTGDETTTSIGTLINGATAKTTPVDADMVGLMDSAATNILKKLSWANIKSTLKTYFDTVYSLSGHNHNGTYQAADADLTAIAGLAGTTGLLKKTAADTWTLDTTAYTTNTGTVTSIATSGAITGGTITSSGTISHSTSDGYLHVPATSTTNNGKALIAGGTAGSFAWTTLTATMVGLGNVTNESKATMFTSPTFTGTPLSTTATVGTNTTQIATTAFVNAEIANDAAPITHVGATGTAHGIATTLVDGFMSSTDKTKLDGIATGATANTGTVTSVSAGNGMTFTTITGSGSITMGTPTGLTATTTNSVSVGTHSHAISTGSAVGLSNSSTNTTGTATSLSRSDHTHAITGFSLDGHTHTDLHTHSNKLVLDKFSEVGGNVLYNGSSISPANLTLTELTLGSRFKISYNLSTDSLDFGVI